jgi:hypothetical protein
MNLVALLGVGGIDVCVLLLSPPPPPPQPPHAAKHNASTALSISRAAGYRRVNGIVCIFYLFAKVHNQQRRFTGKKEGANFIKKSA